MERRRRIGQALFAVIMLAYVTGTSVRKVDDLVKALAGGVRLRWSHKAESVTDLGR